MNFIFLDLETTGFSFRKHQIIDIGLVCLTDSQRLNILVQSVSRVPRKISQLTSITTSQLCAEGIRPRQACMQVWMYLASRQPCVLIGHNIKTFDMPFLIRMFDRCGLLDVLGQLHIDGLVDTLLLFRQYHKTTFKNHKLGTVYQYIFDRPIQNAHRAVKDAEALKQICDSKWFSDHHCIRNLSVIGWKESLDTYWERYLRLSRKTKYESSFCPVCQISISKYFPHYHELEKKKIGL